MRALALAVLAGLLAASSGGAAGKPATVNVTIEGMKFSPAGVTAKPGDTIVWTNKDVVAHTVTSQTNAFDSSLIAPGGTWKFTVKKTGDFSYKCSYHPEMTAAFTSR